MAAKFEATIVPFAGVGVEDALTMLADPEEIKRIPFFGQRAEDNAMKQFPQARRQTPFPTWKLSCSGAHYLKGRDWSPNFPRFES